MTLKFEMARISVLMLISVSTLSTAFIAPKYPFHIRSSRTINIYRSKSDQANFLDAEIIPSKESSASELEYEWINLIELAKRAQPDVAKVRVPFLVNDNNNQKYVNGIDGILHYLVEVPVQDEDSTGSSMRTEKYTIATPADHCVAICFHNDNEQYQILDPSDPVVSSELFKKAGETMQIWFGTNLVLRNTPKTLTVMGDLDRVCDMLREGKIPKQYLDKEDDQDEIKSKDDDNQSVSREALKAIMRQLEIENSTEEEDDAFFEATMRKHLGADFKESTNEAEALSEADKELLALFEMDESFYDLFDENVSKKVDELDIDQEVTTLKQIMAQTGINASDEAVVAERLFAFEHEGRDYSLVRLVQPIILVGKEDFRNAGRQFLLSDIEAAQVMPTLAKLCQEEYNNLLSTGNYERMP